jgi:hypothetical protein
MSHNISKVNYNPCDVNGNITLDGPETMLSEAAPNSTPTGSTFNYALNDYYRWDGTQSNINSSYVTDHADGTYTIKAGVYLIICCVSFQKTYSTNAKADWRWYDQTSTEYFGASVASHVDTFYTNDVSDCSKAQVLEFTNDVRLGLRLTDLITGTFQNSNQDTESNAHLIITRF